ncbi:MAG TPA: ribonucleoside triphosphate reductase [Firmicutes bacterium]|nr:ribonucleoside triphosphate reductase [Bacillota bacterium]
MNRDRPVPLHAQLSQLIRAWVDSGEVRRGQRLPSEREMCRRFGMSRTTVRQAMTAAQQEGLVDCVAGKGRYISCTHLTVTPFHTRRKDGAGMTPQRIVKRDGRLVDFDRERIASAIFKAARAVGGQDRALAERLADQVVAIVAHQFTDRFPTVEDVQDIVEKVLIENGHARTAKAYILYRQQHQELRDFRALLVNAEKMVQDYLDQLDWRVSENSNMNYSLQGLNNHIISAVSARYWLEKIYPPRVREAHQDGAFHIHDLGILSPYCCGWDLADILLHGFAGVGQKVESAPPRHFRTALGQAVNFCYTLQGEAAGAQALANFDTYLAPFIRYDGLRYHEVKQALQEAIFNLNVPTRVGFQTPFVNLTMDVTVPTYLAGQPVIVGGRVEEVPYGEFQREMDMLNLAFCEVMLEGDACGRIFTFPIPTYNITPGFDWESPVAERIAAMTARYGIPYFANFINSDLQPEDVRSMCCRLRLDNRELRRRGGGLFGANPLTGSIGVVTINLPRIGYLAKTPHRFFARLKELMTLARDSLLIKRQVLERFTESGLYPYSRHYLRQVKECLGQHWANHFNTIGLVGMNEALLNFLGEDIGTPAGQQFALQVLDFMREVLVGFQQETGQMFNLEATPAEGASYRLARIDRLRYRDIVTASDQEPYYTNSTQLPAGYTDDVFEALTLQEQLQTRYTGGTVFHAFLGESVEDTKALKAFLQRVLGRFRIPYLTVTPTFSICPRHGYLKGEQPTCPWCQSATEVWSRVVGYYRPVQSWNPGKQEEFRTRRAFLAPQQTEAASP